MLVQEKADRVANFCANHLRHSLGRFAGSPFVLADWQRQIVKDLFGTVKEDGRRQYKRCHIFCPKKVGKSFFASSIALFMLVADGEAGAQVALVANTLDQTRVLFDECCNMIEQDEYLSSICWVRRNLNIIEVPTTRSKLRAMSGDRIGKRGGNYSFCAMDEVSESSPYARDIYSDMQFSMATRTQPLFLTISTSGYDRTSLGWELYETCLRLRDQPDLDPTTLPVLYSAPIGADPFDPVTWRMCCPGLGITIPLEEYEQEAQRAKSNPRVLQDFRIFKLCQWVESSQAWLPAHLIDQAMTQINEASLKGSHAFIGLDLARGIHDLAGYALLIPKDDKLFVVNRFFTPEQSAASKELYERVPYRLWAEQGWITLTQGDVIDFATIKQSILNDAKCYKIVELGYDPMLAEPLTQELREQHGIRTTQITQSYQNLNDATLKLEEMFHADKIRFNSPILKWNILNCTLRRGSSGGVMVDKGQDSRQRIDGATATILALHRWMYRPDCVYRERGCLWF